MAHGDVRFGAIPTASAAAGVYGFLTTPFTNGDTVEAHYTQGGIGGGMSMAISALRPTFLGGDPTTAPARDSLFGGLALALVTEKIGDAKPKLKRTLLKVGKRVGLSLF